MNGMTGTDKMALDLSDNEELSEYFSRKEAGDECTITIDKKYEMTATIDEVEPGKMAVLSLKHEPVESEEGGDAQEPSEPVEAVMGKMMKGKMMGGKPAVDETE